MLLTRNWLVCVVTAILAWSEADALPSVWKRDVTSLAGNASHQDPPVSGICNTSICQQDAKEILESLDKSVDPCDDFYMFACGGWKEKHPATNDTPILNHFNQFSSRVMEQVKLTLEEPFSEEDISPLKAAKKMYQVCMDVETIERAGIQPLVDLSKEFGGWPMALQDWEEGNFSVEGTLAEFDRRLVRSPFFAIANEYIQVDLSRLFLRIREQNIGLSGAILLDPKYKEALEEYKTVIANVAFEIMNATGVNRDKESVRLEAAQIVEFMKQLQNIHSTRTLWENGTLGGLQKWTDSAVINNAYPRFNWLSYVNKILSGTGIVLDEDEILYLKDTKYLFKLVKLLDETPRRVIANYLQWILIDSFKDATIQRMREMTIFQIKAVPRSQHCVQQTVVRFDHVIFSKVFRNIFNEEDKEVVKSLVENTRSSFIKKASNAEWLDDASRSMVRKKVEELTVFIGYPDIFTNATALLDYYKEVNVSNSHFTNMLILTPLLYRRSLTRLRTPIRLDEELWAIHSPDKTNAVYMTLFNAILIPVGQVQNTFFKNGRLQSLNYGRIGVTTSHEISHGYTDTTMGSKWTNATYHNYWNKAKCFVDQYNGYHIPELEAFEDNIQTVNGSYTFQENIADNSGMSIAFEAYETYVKNHGREQRLPGLEEYSPNQMFFIGYATSWCESSTRDIMKIYRHTAHAPPDVRVRGTVSNSEHFATAFNCPAGSNMNPVNKCRMW